MTEYSFFQVASRVGDDDDFKYPKYSDPGRALLRIFQTPGAAYRYDVEVLAYDGCCIWIHEGEGFEFWCENNLDLESEGTFVVENVVGDYHRGDGWSSDDSVDWYFGIVRYASEEEARTAALDGEDG